MERKSHLLHLLNDFKNEHKFSALVWEKRGLNPAKPHISERLETHFNKCAESLIIAINSDKAKSDIKALLKSELFELHRVDFETEEAEFICDYFYQLADFTGIDIKDDLNTWLYGQVLGSLIQLFDRPEKIIETVSQNCSRCNAKLEIFILKKEPHIPDHIWLIVRCKNCNEYNLLSPGPNIRKMRYGNFNVVGELLKENYTEGQVKVRIEQLKKVNNE